jgi:tRNA-dihydrouridine synthase B
MPVLGPFHSTDFCKGVDHFKEYRMRLVTAANLEEVNQILAEIDEKYAIEMA